MTTERNHMTAEFREAAMLAKADTMHRLLAAISDGLTGCPADIAAKVAPRLQAIAEEWGLGDITERCESCWRPWVDCTDYALCAES